MHPASPQVLSCNIRIDVQPKSSVFPGSWESWEYRLMIAVDLKMPGFSRAVRSTGMATWDSQLDFLGVGRARHL